MKKYFLKTGVYELKSGSLNPGLDLNQLVLDTLVDAGLATTEDCCKYTPVSTLDDDFSLTDNMFLVGSDSNVAQEITATQVTSRLDEFIGSTTTSVGVKGLVPEPPINSQNKLLRGDATFGTSIPAWSTATDYELEDIVYSSNIIYRCTTAHTSGGSFDGTKFTALSTAGSGTLLNVTAVLGSGGVGPVNSIMRYFGSTAPTLSITPSVWTINVPSGTELVSVDIYIRSTDNPGANLLLNINTASTVFNQDLSTTRLPHVLGVNLGSGSGSTPANYNPTTGVTNLLPQLYSVPANGDVQILLQNFLQAFGSGAVLLKITF